MKTKIYRVLPAIEEKFTNDKLHLYGPKLPFPNHNYRNQQPDVLVSPVS